MVLLGAARAAVIPAQHRDRFSLLDARQPPSCHHLFGTTDQGSDVFAQVVVGRAALAAARRAAPARSRRSLATVLGIFAAYVGGIVDDIISLVTNVFFVIPTIPLLVDVSGVPPQPRHADDDRS